MKIKHLMLISLMLVILTMGVVSASDDVLSDVNLTTSDNEISDEGFVFDDENIGSSDDIVSSEDVASSESIESGKDEVIASDEREEGVEIFIFGYDREDNSWTNTEIFDDYFAVFYAAEDATGNITVFVNGVQCFKNSISGFNKFVDEWGNSGYYIGVDDVDYDFNLGKYHVAVLYSGDEDYLPAYESNTIRIVEVGYVDDGQDAINIIIWGYDYDDGMWNNIELGAEDFFASIYAPDNATGNITVFINDTQCFKKDISECPRGTDDDGDLVHYIAVDDVDYEFLPGKYLVNIIYDGDESYSSTSESGLIRVVEEGHDDGGYDEVEIAIHGYNQGLEEWEYVKLDGEDFFATIYASEYATGNITVFVNGTQCFKKDISECPQFTDAEGELVYRIGQQDVDYNFSLGKYRVKIVYDGDKYYSPVAESKEIIIVAEDYDDGEGDDDGDDEQDAVEIIIYESVILDGEDFFASIYAPDNATGYITVFVDGTQCFKKDISKCPNYINEYGDLVYCIGPQDVDYDFYQEEYCIKIVYDGDGYYPSVCENKTVEMVDDWNYNDMPDMEVVDVEIDISGCGKDEISWLYTELSGTDYFASIYAPESATGNITVFVDGVQCFKDDISKCPIFSEGSGYSVYCFGPQDLDYDFSPGRYFVKIVYDGDRHYSPVTESNLIRLVKEGYDEEKEGVKIVFYTYEDTKLDGGDCFAAIHAPQEGLTGNITVFVNDTQCLKGEISECLSESGFSQSIYRIGPQDVNYAFSSGKYRVKIVYDGNGYYSSASGTDIVTIIGGKNTHVDGNSHGGVNPSGGAASVTTKNPVQASVKKDTVKLTLKKVKVKRSAKKLVLQATLKINSKAKKGLKVTFKFNGKKFTAKTNKKGIAKVTIKKKLLKKLKIGKKVKIQVSYGTATKNLVVKIKK